MGLFADIRAIIDGDAAASGDVRVRDLIATGTVTSHTLDVSVRSFSCEEAQDGGASCNCDNVPLEGVHVYLCPAWERGVDGAGIDRRPASPIASCDIEADEAAEQEAAERAFLRSFGLGTWLTSQPVRFPTTRVEWGA
jgi:hypothetical protein